MFQINIIWSVGQQRFT